jgi:hypothetical protein
MCHRASVGYQAHEPHGYLTGDYPNGGVVIGDCALAGSASDKVSAVFACGVHPPVTGSLTPGYVLCCSVRDNAANRSQPDVAAGGMRPGEGDVTGAIAPTKPLNALDLCDRCGAQAYVRVLLPNSGELLFCAHHGREHAQALAKVAVDIQDESQRLTKSES